MKERRFAYAPESFAKTSINSPQLKIKLKYREFSTPAAGE
jgi:hypothetical protein